MDKQKRSERQRRMAWLMKEYQATCQKCWKPVILASEGIVQSDPRIATVEHKMPRCLRGSNAKFNLTLYCQGCNGIGSKNIKPWKRMRKRMKKLFTIADITVIEDVIIDGQKQIKIVNDQGQPIGRNNGGITIPIAAKDVQLYLKRQLFADEYIIDPDLDYSKLLLQTGHFEDTGLRLPLKYKILHIWKLKSGI